MSKIPEPSPQTEAKPCALCGFPCRVEGAPDFPSEETAVTLSYRPAVDLVPFFRYDPERDSPGDILLRYRSDITAFERIVAAARLLVNRLEAARLNKSCTEARELLRRALVEQGNYYFPDNQTFVKIGEEFVPVGRWEGFPASGVFLVWKSPERLNASYRWLGEIPEAGAMMAAAAQVHHDRAVKALVDWWDKNAQESMQAYDTATRETASPEVLKVLNEYTASWNRGSAYEAVQVVLNALAEAEQERKRTS